MLTFWFFLLSLFFKTLLARNRHPLLLIFMREMKSSNLLAILDFLHRGEANVIQGDLDSVLAIAAPVGRTDEQFTRNILGQKWQISVAAKCPQYQQWNSRPKDIPESSELCIGTFSQLQSCCARKYFCGSWRTWRKDEIIDGRYFKSGPQWKTKGQDLQRLWKGGPRQGY